VKFSTPQKYRDLTKRPLGQWLQIADDSFVKNRQHALVFLRYRIVRPQSLCVKSERPQKLDTTFTARELEICLRTNIVSETIGKPKNSLRWKVLASICDDRMASPLVTRGRGRGVVAILLGEPRQHAGHTVGDVIMSGQVEGKTA
jgi:hypothetical protein